MRHLLGLFTRSRGGHLPTPPPQEPQIRSWRLTVTGATDNGRGMHYELDSGTLPPDGDEDMQALVLRMVRTMTDALNADGFTAVAETVSVSETRTALS